jgi:hypothetical protein
MPLPEKGQAMNECVRRLFIVARLVYVLIQAIRKKQ